MRSSAKLPAELYFNFGPEVVLGPRTYFTPHPPLSGLATIDHEKRAIKRMLV